MMSNRLIRSFGRLRLTRSFNTISQFQENVGVPLPPSLPLKTPESDFSFILPSTLQTRLKTITDPLHAATLRLRLPTATNVEKLTPTSGVIVPLREPLTEGHPPIVKYAMPWLIGVRHRKMKKHKLKKFRKRMMFVFRKRKLAKRKRKEKEIVTEEHKYKKEGESFNAKSFIEQEMELARKAGWGVYILENNVTGK